MRRCMNAWPALLLFIVAGGQSLAAPDAVYRAPELNLEVELPAGWAASGEPWPITPAVSGLLAFNSWGQAGFQTPGMDRDNVLVYRPKWTLRSVPPGGAVVTLAEEQDGGLLWHAEHYGPEWERQDLRGLWRGGDCRQGAGTTRLRFQKWGRSLLLEVLCQPDASFETMAAVNRLLDSWRFDAEPAGDAGWAALEARALLPWAAFPERFPLLQGRLTPAAPAQSTGAGTLSAWTGGSVLRSTTARLEEDTVVVTFRLRRMVAPGRQDRGAGPYRGRSAEHWWAYEVGPDGSVTPVGEGGAPLPRRAPEERERADRQPARPLASYYDPALGFSLEYPADWQLLEFTRSAGAPNITFASTLRPAEMPMTPPYSFQVWATPLAEGAGQSTMGSGREQLASPEQRDLFVAGCPQDAPVRSFELRTTNLGHAAFAATHEGWQYTLWLHPSPPLEGGTSSDVAARAAFKDLLCSFDFVSSP